MAAKRAFLLKIPGDPRSEYLKATLLLAERRETADALVVPTLTGDAAEPLAAALAAGKRAYLPTEALPERISPSLRAGLSLLTRRGLIICPLTALPRWVQTGINCPVLLTYERLKEFAARGFDRIYLAARPGATPLAVWAARDRRIHLTGGNGFGTCQGDRFGVVYPEK